MYCSRCGTWAADALATCGTCGAGLQTDNWPERDRAMMRVADATAAASAPPVAEVAVRYGGFWRRLGGHLADGVVLFFPSAIARVLLGLGVFSSGTVFSDRREWTDLGFSLVLGLLYQTLLQSSPLEGTLGQRLVDLRITDANGRRLRYPRALARWFAESLSWLTCGLGFLLMLWTPRRQTLHDLVAGTLVVRIPERSRLESVPTHPRSVEAR